MKTYHIHATYVDPVINPNSGYVSNEYRGAKQCNNCHNDKYSPAIYGTERCWCICHKPFSIR